jgi:hypothetical protein
MAVMQRDLFSHYPFVPGARHTDTSVAAADSIAPQVTHLRRVVLDAIRAAGAAGLTADECAARVDLSPLTVRPRVCELREMLFVIDSGKRRANHSGRNAIVWIATP